MLRCSLGGSRILVKFANTRVDILTSPLSFEKNVLNLRLLSTRVLIETAMLRCWRHASRNHTQRPKTSASVCETHSNSPQSPGEGGGGTHPGFGYPQQQGSRELWLSMQSRQENGGLSLT